MRLCACIDLRLRESFLTCLPVCVCVCIVLGTNCVESTGSLFGWNCLEVLPLMNRLLFSRSGALESLGNQ